ncbi:MAG TPA: hypothetical protein VHX37_01965 [Acidobacteriaceae bacterium]|jgi:hypothetical protein|nr:hypothetical protein [Acidobacteriaceae bacterium]
MKQFWLVLFLTIVVAAPLPLMAATARAAITPAEIAAAVNRFGIPIAPEQVFLLSNVQAVVTHPQLRVESVQRWNGQRVIVRLSCANAGECVPFFAELRLNPEGQTQIAAQANPELPASDLGHPVPRGPLVHAGMPATLYLDGDHVHIRLTVICLQNGTAGQTVRATDKERRIVYTALVADSGLLKGHL